MEELRVRKEILDSSCLIACACEGVSGRSLIFYETNSSDTTSEIFVLLPLSSHLQVPIESAYDDPLIRVFGTRFFSSVNKNRVPVIAVMPFT